MIFLASVGIKTAILFFFIKFLNNAKDGLNKLILLLVLFFYCLFNTVSNGNPQFHRFRRAYSRQKACYSNIRVIQGAVEMYNMDSLTMMETLDQTLLEEGRYLKDIIEGPEKDCEYISEGNLADEGYVYCYQHGDLRGEKPERETSSEPREEKPTNIISLIWFYEVKLDKYFISLVENLNYTELGDLLSKLLSLIGLSSKNIVSCGSFVNLLVCVAILYMFKDDKKEQEEEIIVYQAEDVGEEQKDSINPIESWEKVVIVIGGHCFVLER